MIWIFLLMCVCICLTFLHCGIFSGSTMTSRGNWAEIKCIVTVWWIFAGLAVYLFMPITHMCDDDGGGDDDNGLSVAFAFLWLSWVELDTLFKVKQSFMLNFLSRIARVQKEDAQNDWKQNRSSKMLCSLLFEDFQDQQKYLILSCFLAYIWIRYWTE